MIVIGALIMAIFFQVRISVDSPFGSEHSRKLSLTQLSPRIILIFSIILLISARIFLNMFTSHG